MNTFGIYFGPKIVNLIETSGKRIVNDIQIPLSALSVGGLEEKVPDDIKIVAALKDNLRKKSINVREAAICVSGKDWIIRTFEIPFLPRKELSNAVNFEVRKYIPFKVDELISDFQIHPDKSSRKNLILFVGIKKEIINKYLAIINQLNIQVKSIEYSGFSMLRLANLNGIREKGTIGVISVDLSEDEEVNFMVLEDGFPLFSRDITLGLGPGSFSLQDELNSSAALEKLKTEIRISLDYYDRTFRAKNIERMFFISKNDYRSELESFMKEIGHSAHFLESAKFIGRETPFSLSLIKAYTVSLYKTIKTSLKIDLLAARSKSQALKAKSIMPELMPFLVGFKVNPAALIAGLLICLGTIGLVFLRIQPLRQELIKNVKNRPSAVGVSSTANYDELLKIEKKYAGRIATLDALIKKQMFFTSLLNVVPKITPEGTLLKTYSISKEKGKASFSIIGTVSLRDNLKEFESVNNFLTNLKRNNIFAKYFEKINVVSLETKTNERTGDTLTNFGISGLTQKGKEK
ncbi:hypothetical protein D4R78_02220 [bacterium]|nr:MAG: hypothetical protein D4R78_02220 [bacterium]